MRDFEIQPGLGLLKYSRHHDVFDETRLDIIETFPHGEVGFNQAKALLESLKSKQLDSKDRKLKLRFSLEGNDYVNRSVSEAPFAIHGDQGRLGDLLSHTDEDLKSQHADYERVVAYNSSTKSA